VATVRKNQASLSDARWEALIDALSAIRAGGAQRPKWQDFVRVHDQAMQHANMHWGVHSMWMGSQMMRGVNFLAWHRWYLRQFERRLQREDASVAIPYWDWTRDREIPQPLRRPSLLNEWNVVREWNRDEMPELQEARDDVRTMMRRSRFARFQSALELGPHIDVHVAVGGDMNSGRSPNDPVFWLHHAMIDRLWTQWQKKHRGQRPRNPRDRLQPQEMFGVKVSEVLSASNLGYGYA
jgi:tyrosinase